MLAELKRRTGLSRSELIRRAVWLLASQAERSENIHAFLGALAEERLAVSESPAPHSARPKKRSREKPRHRRTVIAVPKSGATG